LVNSMGQQLSHYQKKSYETGEKHLMELQASLESERDMNAKLTEEIAALTAAQANTLTFRVQEEKTLPEGTIVKRITIEAMRGNNHVTATADNYGEAIEMINSKLKGYTK